MMSKTRIMVRTCLACHDELEYIELRSDQTYLLLDAWWQHVDEASLCTPEW